MSVITLITSHEAAAELDGNEYGEEGSRELFERMKNSGVVAVFGASDDLIEFRGAIDNEVGMYGGGVIPISCHGLLDNKCANDRCPYYAEVAKGAAVIDAAWSESGFSWFLNAEFPIQTFTIREGDEDYCRGIVFALADVPR